MEKYVYVIGAGYSRSSYPDFETYTKFYQNYGYTFEVGRTITGDTQEIYKGSPLTNDLLKDALELNIDQITISQEEKYIFVKSRSIVKNWLESLNLKDIEFVRIQDVLTYLDMKITKANTNRRELGKIKFAIANILSILLYTRLGHSTQELDLEFIQFLRNKVDDLVVEGNEAEIIIVDLNWDLVIDNAMQGVFGTSNYAIQGKQGNFETSKSFTTTSYEPDDSIRIKLVKPHGSLNWLWCLGCQALIFFEGKEITRYILPFPDDKDKITCVSCGGSDLEPVIITPSLHRNVFGPTSSYTSDYQEMISRIWEQLRSNLEGMIHLTIIGYSLPAEDKELRYYLRDIILEEEDFKGITIVTGKPKPSPSNQEIIDKDHLDEMKQHHAWEQYLSFFGTELLESVEHNILNFWSYGFFDYFRRFVNRNSLSHAEEGISELIKSLYF